MPTTISVTVGGASETPVKVVYQSDTTANIAQQLANAISAFSQTNPAVNGVPGGQSLPAVAAGTAAIYVVASVGGGAYTPPAGYTDIINSALAPVTITAAAAAGLPYTVLSGSSGTVFDGATNTAGGQILLGGGANTITGTGGLNGNWRIWTGNSIPTAGGTLGTDSVNLGTGNTTVDMGSADTVDAGSGNVLAWVNSRPGAGSAFFIGSGAATVAGGTSGNVTILPGPNGTGGGLYFLGTGGNSYVQAGGGNSTLIGGGANDQLIASTIPGSFNLMNAGAGQNVIVSAAKEAGKSEIWGGTGTETLQGGTGDDTILAGGGTDSIIMGTGQQDLWFSQSYTRGATDIVDNFALEKQSLIFWGYAGAPTVTSAAGQTLQLELSDSTKITFTNLKTGDYATLLNKVIV